MLKVILRIVSIILVFILTVLLFKVKKEKEKLNVEKNEETSKQIERVFGNGPLRGEEVKEVTDNIREKFEDKEKKLNQAEIHVVCLMIMVFFVALYVG